MRTSTAKIGNGGFTLVELMVALIVLGLALTITVPNVQRSLDRAKTDGALSELQSDLKLAISTARATGRAVRIEFGADGYRIVDAVDTTRVYRTQTMHSGVAIQASGNPVIFPWGQVQPANVQLNGHDNQHSIQILPTGRIEPYGSGG